jgi:hypothetical protein
MSQQQIDITLCFWLWDGVAPHANCTGNQKANIQQMHPTGSLRQVEAKLKCSVLVKTDLRVIIVCVCVDVFPRTFPKVMPEQ